MKNPLKPFKRLLKIFCYPLLRFVIGKIDSYATMFNVEQFYSKLKCHGMNCWVQWPIQVTGHESISIGNNVTIASFVHIWGEGGVVIGDRVMIASHTAITSLTHDYNQYYMHKTLIKGQIVIEDDVWIGSHAVIVPGITIGKGAVVGAGSVVTKNVDPYAIVVGIPARVLKYRNEVVNNND